MTVHLENDNALLVDNMETVCRRTLVTYIADASAVMVEPALHGDH